MSAGNRGHGVAQARGVATVYLKTQGSAKSKDDV